YLPDEFACFNSATLANVAFASFRASSLQPSQHKNTGWPSIISLIGGPIEPSRLFEIGHNRCASAKARSSGDSFASAAFASLSNSPDGSAGGAGFGAAVGAFSGAACSVAGLLFNSATFANVACGFARAFCLQPLQHKNTGCPSIMSFTGGPIEPSRLL